MSDSRDPRQNPGIEWAEARSFLRTRLDGLIGSQERSDLDDLVQEACVRLLRATRDAEVHELEGLMTRVARRTWIDDLRRRSRRRRYLVWFGDESQVGAQAALLRDELGDLSERIGLIVQEIFTEERAVDCQHLSNAYLASASWTSVAAELELSHAAVRKRWSRCLTLLRSAMMDDPDLATLFGKEA